jgi:hypothetical protein
MRWNCIGILGMPHIYAVREQDVFYGLGYATGGDRLVQVLTWYVALRGPGSLRQRQDPEAHSPIARGLAG